MTDEIIYVTSADSDGGWSEWFVPAEVWAKVVDLLEGEGVSH